MISVKMIHRREMKSESMINRGDMITVKTTKKFINVKTNDHGEMIRVKAISLG